MLCFRWTGLSAAILSGVVLLLLLLLSARSLVAGCLLPQSSGLSWIEPTETHSCSNAGLAGALP